MVISAQTTGRNVGYQRQDSRQSQQDDDSVSRHDILHHLQTHQRADSPKNYVSQEKTVVQQTFAAANLSNEGTNKKIQVN